MPYVATCRGVVQVRALSSIMLSERNLIGVDLLEMSSITKSLGPDYLHKIYISYTGVA